MQHLLHQCGWCGPVLAGAGLLLPGPSRISFIHSSTALQSAVYTGAQLTASLPAAAGPVKAHCDTVCAPPNDIQCSVKQIQIPTVQMELERPPAADIVNI